ncbi:MAG: hypothetical protein AB7N91_30715 [Candidatus Tectimicrobiota bacterium]
MATELLLVGFAVLQHLRVETEAGVDQEHAVIEETHLHQAHRGGE